MFIPVALSVNFTNGQNFIETLSQPGENTEGYVIVEQSTSIETLLNRTTEINKKSEHSLQGYRIQLFSDYKQAARELSSKQIADFISKFPDFDASRIYRNFEPPFVKVRVGDYRDANSALLDFVQIVKYFPDSYIIKSNINYPPI